MLGLGEFCRRPVAWQLAFVLESSAGLSHSEFGRQGFAGRFLQHVFRVMHNIGEELVGSYLQVIKGCDFVHYNYYTPDVQGEIDVIGLDMRRKIIYVCEVAIHLITGLQYVKAAQPDNVNRLISKFQKDIDFAFKYFADYTKVFMLWSPIVKLARTGSKHCQHRDVQTIKETLKQSRDIDLQLIVNEKFKECLDELKIYAAMETKELKSPVLRLLQIDAKLARHLTKT